MHSVDAIVEMQAKLSGDLEVNPGSILTFTVCAQNSSEEDLMVYGKAIMPDGWKLLYCDEGEVFLEKNTSFTCLGAVKIPANAFAGNFVLEYQFSGRQGEWLAGQKIEVVVLPEANLMLVFEDKERILAAGEYFTIPFSFFNKGNTILPIRFELKSDPDCRIVLEQEETELQPNEQKWQEFLVCPPNLPFSTGIQHITLTAKHSQTQQILESRTLLMEVLQRGEPYTDSRVKIPSSFRVLSCGDNFTSTVAMEISGAGKFDENLDREIEFNIQIPSNFRNTVFNEYQRFYGAYHDSDKEINIGDFCYALTTLTERGRYSRGGSAKIGRNGIEIGGMYAQNLYRTSYNFKEWGVFSLYSLGENQRINCSFFSKQSNCEPSAKIVSIQAVSEKDNGSQLEVELARNLEKTCHDSLKKNAFRIEAQGVFGNGGWYQAENIYTGRHFYGYYNDYKFLGGCVQYPIKQGLNLAMSANCLKQNGISGCECGKKNHLPLIKGNFPDSFPIPSAKAAALP